jgi:hypothetical protein
MDTRFLLPPYGIALTSFFETYFASVTPPRNLAGQQRQTLSFNPKVRGEL